MSHCRLVRITVFVALTVISCSGWAVGVTWNTDFGNWSLATNWSPVGVPTAANDVLVNDSAQADLVTINIAANALSLTIADGLTDDDAVDIQNGRLLTLHGGGLTSDGSLFLNAGVSATYLRLAGAQTLGGTGEIVLSNSVNNIIDNDDTITTVGPDLTVRGAGKLINNSGGLVNNGTILAQGSQTLTIWTKAGHVLDQNGTLRAEGTGGLVINNSIVELDGGNSIDVDSGSALLVQSSTLNNGTLNIAGPASADLRSSTLDNMVISGNVHTNNAQINTLENGITLDGTWNLNAGVSATYLRLAGAQTLDGTGEIVLSNSVNNIIDNDDTITTIGPDLTVRGAGKLINNSGGLVNEGTILAQGSQTLTIRTKAGHVLDQNGTLRAEGTGGLVIDNSIVELDGGNSIDVDSGSALLVQSSTLNNGTLNIADPASADLRSSTLDNMVINGNVHTNNAQINTLENGITLDGIWNLNAGVSATYLRLTGAQTLGGTGEIVLSNSVNNIIDNDDTITTVGPDLTVRGAGKLINNSGGLVNEGTILAQGSQTLTIRTKAGHVLDQNGTLRAEGTGGLVIDNSIVELDGGNSIDVDSGSALLVQSSTLNNGTLNIADPTSADLRSSTLDNMVINGNVHTNNAQINTLENGITLDGIWNLNAGVSATYLRLVGAQTLGGTGEVVLSNSVNNIIDNDDTITTIGPDLTVRGAGKLVNNSGGLVNEGTILAQGSQTLTIRTKAGHVLDQNGTLRAEGAGGLVINNSIVELDGGNSIDVDSGSALLVQSSTLNNGTLNIADPASADLRSVTLDNMVINGNVHTNNGQLNTVKNGVTIDGTWALNASVSATYLRVNGAQTLGGTGEIALSNSVNNIIDSATSTVTTIGPDLTVRGAGKLINNSGGLLNKGTIVADATSVLLVNVNGLGAVNEGTLIASGAGGMTFQEGYVQNGPLGVTRVDSRITLNTGIAEISGGVLQGTGTVFGDVVVNGAGTVNPGNSTGTLTVDETYTQTSGATLLIEIGGASDFDMLHVDDQASLGGLIDVDLLAGYIPMLGQSFDVLIAGSILGAFDNPTVSAGGVEFAVTYIDAISEDIVRLTVTSAVPLPAPLWLLLAGLVPLLRARSSRQTA